MLVGACGASEPTGSDAGSASIEHAVRLAGLRVCETRRGDAPPSARRQWVHVVAEDCPAAEEDDVLVRVTDWDDAEARDFAAAAALTSARRGSQGQAVRTLGRLTIEISGPRSGDLAGSLLDRLAEEGAS